MSQQLDSPWKEVVDQHLPALLELLAPEVDGDIDWTRDVESLEQELRKMAPEGETGSRYADKLLKVWTKSGDERYLHFEAQARPQAGFERRVYEYHYRIDDRFKSPPEAVILLADDDVDWRPVRYVVRHKRTRLTFEFDPVKLHDWAVRAGELIAHPNPVALFVLAHLESLRTRGDDDERARVKLALILRLHDRKLDAEELRHWYRYLDWLLALPKEIEKGVWDEIKRIEQEKKMPYISFAERHGMEIGLEKGLEQGLEKGERLGLLKNMRLALKLKFGEAGVALLPEIERIDKLELIQAVFDAIDPASSIDDLKRLLA